MGSRRVWNDAVIDAVGAVDAGQNFSLVIGGIIVLVVVGGILRLIGEAFRYPPMWPMLIGGFGFWPLLFTGHPFFAFATCMLGMAGMALMQGIPRYTPHPATASPAAAGPATASAPPSH